MKTYTALTLGELIEALQALPATAFVRGLDDQVESYRGFYERNAIAPTSNHFGARELAGRLENEDGKSIQGWKGGDFSVDLGELVYLAHDGDTGPNIIGLELNDETGEYEPVLLTEADRLW